MENAGHEKQPRPDLHNIAQHGGAYHQVLDLGEHILAVRTGGLELLMRTSGQWRSVSHLPLCTIPTLSETDKGVFAQFRNRRLKLAVDDAHRINVISDDFLSFDSSQTPLVDAPIRRGNVTFQFTKANAGLTITSVDGSMSCLRLPGYSRPSSLSFSKDESDLFVTDVGAIHTVNLSSATPELSSGHYCCGWPKDIACDEQGVYCANVLGVQWYRETSSYPYLEQIDKLSQLHFRIAKVIVHSRRIIACDEVRGLHFFAAEYDKLRILGGLMLEGGAWDCHIFNGHLLVATGENGWVTAPFMPESMTVGAITRHMGSGRVHSVVPWPEANCYVILSSKGIAIHSLTHDGLASAEIIPGFCLWGAAAIGKFMVVAAAKHGIVLLKYSSDKQIIVVSQLETVEARDVCFDGQFVWVADGKGGIRCYVLDDVEGILKFQGVFPIAGFSRGVMSTGKRVYIGAGDGGLVVLESEDCDNP